MTFDYTKTEGGERERSNGDERVKTHGAARRRAAFERSNVILIGLETPIIFSFLFFSGEPYLLSFSAAAVTHMHIPVTSETHAHANCTGSEE